MPGQAGPENAPWQLTHNLLLRTTSAILGQFFVFGPPTATSETSRPSAPRRCALTQLRTAQEFKLDRETKHVSFHYIQCIGLLRKGCSKEPALFIQCTVSSTVSYLHRQQWWPRMMMTEFLGATVCRTWRSGEAGQESEWEGACGRVHTPT